MAVMPKRTMQIYDCALLAGSSVKISNEQFESGVLNSVLSLIVHIALCGATWCSSPCWQALRLSCLSENRTK